MPVATDSDLLLVTSTYDIVGQGFLAPLYCLLYFFQILFDPPTLPHHLHLPPLLLFLLPSFGSKYVKSWYLSTRRTLLCVLCNIASSSLRSDTCGFLLGDLIHMNTHTKTAHTHEPMDSHTHINIY